MREQVALRKAEIRQELSEGREMERSDVFSRLVLANESETEKLPVDDQELVWKMYQYLRSFLTCSLSRSEIHLCYYSLDMVGSQPLYSIELSESLIKPSYVQKLPDIL